MSTKMKILSAWMAIALVVMACSISTGEDEEAALETAVAQTVAASIPTATQQAAQPPLPTVTTGTLPTLTSQPTSTPQPCNKAEFISETVLDDTEFNVGSSFTKSWRLKNTGTCTWNTNYKLVFYSGDQMSGPATKNLPNSVAPGEQIDLSVDLKAPNTAGTYEGTWRVIDDKGEYFVFRITVKIKAKAILAPPPIAKPDLTITEFSIAPPTPVQGSNAHVKVRAANIGTADSGGFKMDWYGLTTFANPSCSWNIAGGLVAGGSVLMECDFVFASWYPIDKTSIVYIDTGNTVSESNEGNNSRSISPFGVIKP
jgi:hypothetical protein